MADGSQIPRELSHHPSIQTVRAQLRAVLEAGRLNREIAAIIASTARYKCYLDAAKSMEISASTKSLERQAVKAHEAEKIARARFSALEQNAQIDMQLRKNFEAAVIELETVASDLDFLIIKRELKRSTPDNGSLDTLLGTTRPHTIRAAEPRSFRPRDPR